MKISIIIVNYNRAEETEKCLISIAKLNIKGLRLSTIVVDNASIDNSVNLIKKRFPDIKLIINKENLGFAQGNNIGIKEALKDKADFVWFLNNDTTVERDCLLYLLNAFKVSKTIGVVIPKIYFAAGYEYHRECYKKGDLGKVIWYAGGYIDWRNILGIHRGLDEVDKGQYDTFEKTGFVNGCLMGFDKAVVEKVGLWDESYFLYFEDADYCERAKQKQILLYYDPTIVIYHKNAQSTGGSGSKTHGYYQRKNRFMFGLKYAPLRTKLHLLSNFIRDQITGTSK